MNIKNNLKSGRLAFVAMIACIVALVIAVLIVPGRGGRLISPIAWLGVIVFGGACLFSRTMWHKAAGALSVALVVGAALLTERVGEILLYLVASGAWLYEGAIVLALSAVIFRFVPASPGE